MASDDTTNAAAPGRERRKSAILFERANSLLPGGVSSPVRAFKAVGGTPIFVRSGEGATIEDEDGNRYIDYCMSWGPLALGHAHPAVVRAVAEAASRGLTFGTPTAGEVELAALVSSLYPAAERVRFVSSGTEAVMSAVRLARAFTGRDLIVKFEGCYHGHADYLLVKAGSGLVTAGQPDSAGVPKPIAATTAVLPLDDEASFRTFMAARGREVASVLIEPVPANAGLLLQQPAFLRALREECDRAGALLIFDEVISGFRLGPGGAAALYGVRPDLATFGKVIGGGMPVGAYAGRAEIMSLVAPLGPVYQAGTLSGNPVAMAAGRATLEVLLAGGFEALEDRSRRLALALSRAIAAATCPVRLVRQGSIFWIVFQDQAPRAYGSLERAGARRYAAFYRALLERGIYFPPSAFEVFFASTAHTDAQIEETGRAVAESLRIAAGVEP